MSRGTGTIEIDLIDFWEWVDRYHKIPGEYVFGVPRINKKDETIEIDYAYDTSCHPNDWHDKPKFLDQWK